MAGTTSIIKLRISNTDLALFKYILESHENLASLSCDDPEKETALLYIPDGNYDDVIELLSNLSAEIGFQILEQRSSPD